MQILREMFKRVLKVSVPIFVIYILFPISMIILSVSLIIFVVCYVITGKDYTSFVEEGLDLPLIIGYKALDFIERKF